MPQFGQYAIYIWLVYEITFFILLGTTLLTLLKLRKMERLRKK